MSHGQICCRDKARKKKKTKKKEKIEERKETRKKVAGEKNGKLKREGRGRKLEGR